MNNPELLPDNVSDESAQEIHSDIADGLWLLLKETHEKGITEASLQKQISLLESKGFVPGAKVAFKGEPKRVGEIVAFNTERSGFYPADSYPLRVSWDGDSTVFEYGLESVRLKK